MIFITWARYSAGVQLKVVPYALVVTPLTRPCPTPRPRHPAGVRLAVSPLPPLGPTSRLLGTRDVLLGPGIWSIVQLANDCNN